MHGHHLGGLHHNLPAGTTALSDLPSTLPAASCESCIFCSAARAPDQAGSVRTGRHDLNFSLPAAMQGAEQRRASGKRPSATAREVAGVT